MIDTIECPTCSQINAADNPVCVICRSPLDTPPAHAAEPELLPYDLLPVASLSPTSLSSAQVRRLQVIDIAHWLIYGVLIAAMILSTLWFTRRAPAPTSALFALGIIFAVLAAANLRAHHRFKIRYARHLPARAGRLKLVVGLAGLIALVLVALALDSPAPANPAQHFNILMALTCGIAGAVGSGIVRRHAWVHHLPRFMALLVGMIVLYYASRQFSERSITVFLGLAALNLLVWYWLTGRKTMLKP